MPPLVRCREPRRIFRRAVDPYLYYGVSGQAVVRDLYADRGLRGTHQLGRVAHRFRGQCLAAEHAPDLLGALRQVEFFQLCHRASGLLRFADAIVVIGKAGKNISQEQAMEHVWGYTVINDISARDLQMRHQQFFKGKALDGSCPMGPWIITSDELTDPHNLVVRLRVNGEIKQESNTNDLIFNIPTLIHVLSQGMTLEPGDIIATGTPAGVGFARTPQEFLRPGDLLETEVEGIGILRNPVVAG